MNRFLNLIAEIRGQEYGCGKEAFFSDDEVLYINSEEIPFRMISFGCTTVICGRQDILNTMKKKINPKMEGKLLFDAPCLYDIGEVLKQYGLSLSEINDYYIPFEGMEHLANEIDGRLDIKRMSKEDILRLKNADEYGNALCPDEAASINEFAYAAMDRNTIASIAGISSNSEKIWWVGVDTKKIYRRKGLASALVAKVAAEAMEMDRIPVYVTWYSNIASRKTALCAGFVPGFVELGCE